MRKRGLLGVVMLAAVVMVIACDDTLGPDGFGPSEVLLNKGNKGGGKQGDGGPATVTVHLTGAAVGEHADKNFKESARQVEISGGPQAQTTFAFAGARGQYNAGRCIAAHGSPDGPSLDVATANALAGWLEAEDVLAGFSMTYDSRSDGQPSSGHDLIFHFFDNQGRGVNVAIFARGDPPPTIARNGDTFTVSGGVVRVWLRDGPPKNHPKLFCGAHSDEVTLTVVAPAV
jgi:hypothetical protein